MRTLATLGLLAALAIPCAASAQAPSATTLFRRGMAAFGAERYAEAATLFEQAHALSGDAHMLYNLALARDRAGDAAGALASYRDFVSAWPDAPERGEVEARMAELAPPAPEPVVLETTPQTIEPVVASPEPEPVTVPAEVLAPSIGPEVSAGGPVLLGIGAAGLVTAGVLGFVASDTHARAEREPIQLAAISIARDADGLALASNVAWGVAGAVALAGGIWTLVDLTSTPSRSQRIEARARVGPSSVSFVLSF